MVRATAFGTYDAEAHPRVAVLIEGLRAHGWSVTEVNAPLGLPTARRVDILRRPWKLPVLAGAILRAWVVLLWRSYGTRPEVVVVGYLGHFDVLLARIRWPRTPIVLDHLVSARATALDRGANPGLKTRLLGLLDELALCSADIVVVDTDESARRLPEAARVRAVVVPVGATAAWFDRPARPTTVAAEPLRVIFFGLFTPLHGAGTIGRALARIDPGVLSVTLVGHGQDHEVVHSLLVGRRDVAWRDWVPGADLPALVSDHDVCLGIFGDTPKALTVVPTKVYQGVAAGCAVLTSDTLPQRRALDEAASFVPPADPSLLAERLTHLAADRAEVTRLRDAGRRRAKEAFTARAVTDPLVRRVETVRALSARQGSTAKEVTW